MPDRPLPPYRYVPGLNPHPFRHIDGHMYTDGSAPEALSWTLAETAQQDVHFLFAADLFDHRFFWEAHEAWEAMWHQAPHADPTRDLLQSLIQCAAAALQHHMCHSRSAVSLHGRAEERLGPWIQQDGPHIYGVDAAGILSDTAALLAGGPWPKIRLVKS
jgi:predicted metal-dependent hydrolase